MIAWRLRRWFSNTRSKNMHKLNHSRIKNTSPLSITISFEILIWLNFDRETYTEMTSRACTNLCIHKEIIIIIIKRNFLTNSILLSFFREDYLLHHCFSSEIYFLELSIFLVNYHSFKENCMWGWGVSFVKCFSLNWKSLISKYWWISLLAT